MDDGWIEWAGGDCPVAVDTKVRVRFDEDEFPWDDAHIEEAGYWSSGSFDWWKHEGPNRYSHIRAYKVVG